MRKFPKVTDWLKTSDALHARVQALIHSPETCGDSFEELALAIARFQASRVPAYARLVAARGVHLTSVDAIPAVPVEAFRLARIAVHPMEFDEARFLTSGTTSGSRGQHCMRRTDTYRSAALTWGRYALLPGDGERVTVTCLAPPPSSPQSSSLGFMMQAFLEAFDPDGAREGLGRWLLRDSAIDLAQLRSVLAAAAARRRTVLLLATSFALAYLLEALQGQSIPFDGRLIVMQTGGFKGKTREISAAELECAIVGAFAVSSVNFVGEYGMTELSSQLYEGSVVGAGLSTPSGWYVPPPWLRVNAVDPIDYRDLADGEEGLGSFLDLANVDSAVRILTADRIVRRGNAIRLLGRAVTSPARGCSLTDEELLSPQ